jgi:hypothetical protein
VRYLSGETREVDQSSLPICFLGQIADLNNPQPAQCLGAEALRNASPIGKQWKLKLAPVSTAGIETSQLDDVQIFLHVAVRGVKA